MKTPSLQLNQIFETLLSHYGPQGWWPIKSSLQGVNTSGYHPKDYSFPREEMQRFEIMVGAVLTQNTNWRNVSMVLKNLIRENLLIAQKMALLTQEELSIKIRSTGYHNQKAKKLKILCDFLLLGDYLKGNVPSRKDLLALWGIGPETADSIGLYAYGRLDFVIDLYTRRILSRLGFYVAKDNYDSWQDLCVSTLPKDLRVYQEFHGLILAHAKKHCGANTQCKECPLYNDCPSKQLS
ncbi:MAG: hypothetical protein PF447_00455 [Spirochaetaceae bacterium]|jgi:endonuclease-3 related protein|nr:hypothetical protein [Spirochaetaceae bacterium]